MNYLNYNVSDAYKGMSPEDIKNDIQKRSHSFAVLMEHWKGDFNISTLVRNANAFNAKEVYYVGKKKWDRRGAVGTHHYIDLNYIKNNDEILFLKEKYTFIGIDNNLPNTIELNHFNWQQLEKPPLMIFGEEKQGITQETLNLCDYVVEIPQFGSVRSLNVGTSSGIIMYDYINKLRRNNNGMLT